MLFRILKVIATSGFLKALGCTKLVFGRGSAPDPAGGAYSAPQTLAALGGVLLKGEGEKAGKVEEGGEGKERGGEGERKGENLSLPTLRFCYNL